MTQWPTSLSAADITIPAVDLSGTAVEIMDCRSLLVQAEV